MSLCVALNTTKSPDRSRGRSVWFLSFESAYMPPCVTSRVRSALCVCGSYLDWETFQIIYQELFQGLGLCLLAVFVLTLILIAHPGTALLVFLCVTFTIVDVLGIM